MDIQPANASEQANTISVLQQEIVSELEQSQRSLKEVNLMLDQSQTELNKLTQRSAAIASRLQQVQDQYETMPKSEIRTAYNAALDAQQRLLLMRSQLEKLQADKNHIIKYIGILEKINRIEEKEEEIPNSGKSGKSSASILEMIVNAQEAERQKISRQMHDGPAQTLSNFIVQAEIVTRLLEINPAKAKEELNNIRTATMTSFQKVRDFIFELRPMMLDDLGMVPTIRKYIDSYKEQSGADITIIVGGEQENRLEPYIEVMVFRALQELLDNAVSNNKEIINKLKIKVQLNIEGNLVRLSVSDNGVGFDAQGVSDSSGFGLKLIKERVEMLGGTFDIDAASGQGCKVTFQIPNLELEK
jgi:two-component system sensor histidine kinase DegS